MLKNLKNRKWWECALIRAVRTMAQVALGMITPAVVLADIDFIYVLSATALSGLYSLLTSLSGLPEADIKGVDEDDN